MSSLDDKIKLARRQVLQSRRIVAAQRLRMAVGATSGEEARRLLASFERSLEIVEQDLERLLRQGERETTS